MTESEKKEDKTEQKKYDGGPIPKLTATAKKEMEKAEENKSE